MKRQICRQGFTDANSLTHACAWSSCIYVISCTDMNLCACTKINNKHFCGSTVIMCLVQCNSVGEAGMRTSLSFLPWICQRYRLCRITARKSNRYDIDLTDTVEPTNAALESAVENKRFKMFSLTSQK